MSMVFFVCGCLLAILKVWMPICNELEVARNGLEVTCNKLEEIIINSGLFVSVNVVCPCSNSLGK